MPRNSIRTSANEFIVWKIAARVRHAFRLVSLIAKKKQLHKLKSTHKQKIVLKRTNVCVCTRNQILLHFCAWVACVSGLTIIEPTFCLSVCKGKHFAFLIVPKASDGFVGESEICASLWQQFEPHQQWALVPLGRAKTFVTQEFQVESLSTCRVTLIPVEAKLCRLGAILMKCSSDEIWPTLTRLALKYLLQMAAGAVDAFWRDVSSASPTLGRTSE